MIALLSTNFFRIRRDLLFWLALCVCLVGGIAFGMGFRGTPAFDDFYFPSLWPYVPFSPSSWGGSTATGPCGIR